MPAVQPAYTDGDQYGTNNVVATGGPNSVEAIRGRNYKHFMDREEQVNMARRYMQTRGVPMTQKNLLQTMAWLSGEDIVTPEELNGVDAAMATVDAGDAGNAGTPTARSPQPEQPSSPIPQPRPEQMASVDSDMEQVDPNSLIPGLTAGTLSATLAARNMASRYLPGRRAPGIDEAAVDERGRTIDPLTGEVLDPQTSQAPQAPQIAQADKAGSRPAIGASPQTGAGEVAQSGRALPGRGPTELLSEGEARSALSNARNNPGQSYDIGNGQSVTYDADRDMFTYDNEGLGESVDIGSDGEGVTSKLRETLKRIGRAF